MARRIITAEDVEAMAPGTRLVLDDGTTLTGAARDLARRRGLELVEGPGVTAESGGATAGATPPSSGGPGVGAASGGGGAGASAESASADEVDERVAGPPGRIIATAVGVNRTGILSEVTGAIGSLGGDIQDVSQLISGGYFNAILIVDISRSGHTFAAFRDALKKLSEPTDYVVTVVDERVVQAMHRL